MKPARKLQANPELPQTASAPWEPRWAPPVVITMPMRWATWS
jgi:hypothetical protein